MDISAGRRAGYGVVAVALALLTLAGCGDDSPARPSSAAQSSAQVDSIVAFLQEPDLGLGLSDEMARCEAEKALASGHLSRKMLEGMSAKPGDEDPGWTDEEMDAFGDTFAVTFNEAEAACIKEIGNDEQ
jgi:hypothetical protein